MKFFHISDLHLGKRLNEFSLLEDQEFILGCIKKAVKEEKPDAVLIAGDIYDKSVPPAEAVSLFDSFITELNILCPDIFIISGNHDSPERLSFASSLIDAAGVHISPVYDGNIRSYSLKDEFGAVNIYMLPFIKPAHVKRYFPEEEINSYTDAVKTALSAVKINREERNILMTHQFVTGSKRSESEDVTVGGTDNVDASCFEDFDYVALGHIHSPQNCTSPYIRYCGTPLKYSFSEARDKKSITEVTMKEKGNTEISFIPLVPMRDMCEIKGKYNDIMLKSFYENTGYKTDYMHITLTDEEDVPDAVAKLRTVYSNLMTLSYENTRTKKNAQIEAQRDIKNKLPSELFEDLYEMQNNAPMSDVQRQYIKELEEKIWGDKN